MNLFRASLRRPLRKQTITAVPEQPDSRSRTSPRLGTSRHFTDYPGDSRALKARTSGDFFDVATEWASRDSVRSLLRREEPPRQSIGQVPPGMVQAPSRFGPLQFAQPKTRRARRPRLSFSDAQPNRGI